MSTGESKIYATFKVYILILISRLYLLFNNLVELC